MSYCRWSSNGFRSDIYAYEHVAGGVTVHIAGNRQRWWYNALGRAANHVAGHHLYVSAPELGNAKRADGSDILINGKPFPTARLPGGWWRNTVAAMLKFPAGISRCRPYALTHWLTHYSIPELAQDKHGLTYAQAIEFLLELRTLGYQVPEYALEGLRRDEAADPGGPTPESTINAAAEKARGEKP